MEKKTKLITKTIVACDIFSGRMANKISHVATQYREANIFIQKHYGNRRVNCKSILGLLSLGIRKLDKVDILVGNEHKDKAVIIEHLSSIIGGVDNG